MQISDESESPRGTRPRRRPRTVLVPPLPFQPAASQSMSASSEGSPGETHTGLPPSPVTHVGPAPSVRMASGTPPPIPALDTAPYPKRKEDSVEIEIDVELEAPAPMDVDFTEPTERVDVETIDVDHLDPIEHTDPGDRQGPRVRRPRVTHAGIGAKREATRVEVTRVGVAPTRVARHIEKRLAHAPVRTDDATVPYPRSEVPEAGRTIDEDPATVKFTRPYERFEIDIARESETPHVPRELVVSNNLVHETQAIAKRDPVSAPYETLEIAPMRTDQILRQCQRRANPIWRWAIAGLILGAGAFACGLSLAHLILR